MGLVNIGDFIPVGGWVLALDFVQEGVSGFVLGCAPLRRIRCVGYFRVVGSRTWCTSIAFIEPRFSINECLLFWVVPKNLGPTE